MNSIKIPIPNGFETIEKSNGETITLNKVLEMKKWIKKKVKNSQKKINADISDNNFIDYAIIYEYYTVNNIIQPDNIVNLYDKFNNIFSTALKNNKTISKKQFKNLKTVKSLKCLEKYTQKNNLDCNDSCLICTSSFNNKSHITILPCNHYFGSECIKKWLVEESNLCPICRQSVV